MIETEDRRGYSLLEGSGVHPREAGEKGCEVIQRARQRNAREFRGVAASLQNAGVGVPLRGAGPSRLRRVGGLPNPGRLEQVCTEVFRSLGASIIVVLKNRPILPIYAWL